MRLDKYRHFLLYFQAEMFAYVKKIYELCSAAVQFPQVLNTTD